MKKTFSFKLYRCKRNRFLHKRIDSAASVFNHCIALHKKYYRLFGRHLNKYQLQKHLTKLKKRERYQHWKEVGSQAIQDITDRIERGYQLFFQLLSSKQKVSPPSFRSRKKYKSITLKQAGYKLLEGNKLQIGSRVYKFHKSREIEGKIKTLTIKRDALGDVYLFFSCEVSDTQVERILSGKSVGFDFGLKCFLTCSNGEEVKAPQFYRQGVQAVKRSSRQLSRKQKGSRNRNRARLHHARVHKRIANQRRDYHFQEAKRLSESYDYLYFEDLDIKSMHRKWGRKVGDLAFSEFLKILEHACKKRGAKLCKIDRYYPSSKQCHRCFKIKSDLSLKEREWVCTGCGVTHDRDQNAAKNIYRVGASTLGEDNVRPALVQAVIDDTRIPIHS